MLASIRAAVARVRASTTLGQQVVFYVSTLCLILVGVLSFTAAETARQQAIARIEGSMTSLALSMSDRLNTYLSERQKDVVAIAGMPPLQTLWTGDPARIRPVLDAMQANLPDYVWVGFARSDGTVTAASAGMLEGASVADRPWFLAGMKGPMIDDVHEAKLLAGLLGPNKLGEPFRLVDVAAPIRGADGTTIGVLGTHLSWTWGDDLRKRVLSRLDPALKTDIWVISAEGKVLLGPEFGIQPFSAEELTAIRSTGRQTFTDTSRQAPALTHAMVATEGPARDLGWIVVSRRPLDVAFAEANRIASTIGWIGLALAAMALLAAVLLARRIGGPLRQLAAKVDLIGRDPTVTTVRRQQGSREIIQLSASIRSLVRRIATAESAEVLAKRDADALAQRMEEKTRQFGEHINALQVLADTDPLTQLLNRRAFLSFANDAMNHFRCYGHGLAVLVIDIDFFKRVNDVYGHATGDEVIRTVGGAIASQVRGTDKVARIGGEEFVVMLRETDLQGVMILADRIRSTVADMVIDSSGQGPVNVTVSVGLAMAQASDRDIEDVIERADRGLYRAKHQGRNMVIAEHQQRESNAA